MPWKELTRNSIYENPWISLTESQVISPNGDQVTYGVVRYKKVTAAILPIVDKDHVLLVGQHRFPFGSYSWEIPMGGSEVNEDPSNAAVRELLEETGYKAESPRYMMELHPSNGVTTERVLLYYTSAYPITSAQPDATESMDVSIVSIREAVDMAINGQIKDATTVAALLAYNLRYGA